MHTFIQDFKPTNVDVDIQVEVKDSICFDLAEKMKNHMVEVFNFCFSGYLFWFMFTSDNFQSLFGLISPKWKVKNYMFE